MKLNSNQLLEKLAELDPENDEHWTADGQVLLAAIGEGVTRPDLMAIAPKFNRKNPVLPDATDVPQIEAEPTFEEKMELIRMELQDAQAVVEAATKVKEEADKSLAEANRKLEVLRDEQRNLDKRSDAEINQELIYRDLEIRLQKAGQHSELLGLMKQAGIRFNGISMDNRSAADQAIAAKNIRERKERHKKNPLNR